MDAADVVGAGAPEPAGPPGLDSTPFASADDIVRAPGGVERLRQAMLQTSSNVGALQALLPQAVVVDLLGRATALLKAEPTLVEVSAQGSPVRIEDGFWKRPVDRPAS